MLHLSSPGAWQRAGMGGQVTGLCWAGLMAVTAGHPDAAQVTGLARAAELVVLRALADQAQGREANASTRSMLDAIGPQEPFTTCAPTGDLDLTGLLA